MAKKDKEKTQDTQTAADGGQKQPPMTMTMQYVKDLSFESPNAPTVFVSVKPEQPDITIGTNVKVQPLSEHDFEVVLSLRGEAKLKEQDKLLYLLELSYAGLVRFNDEVKPEAKPIALNVEAPHLLFPFARQVFSQTIMAGGFPAPLLNPMDFMGMFRQHVQRLREQQKQQGQAAPQNNGSNSVGNLNMDISNN